MDEPTSEQLLRQEAIRRTLELTQTADIRLAGWRRMGIEQGPRKLVIGCLHCAAKFHCPQAAQMRVRGP